MDIHQKYEQKGWSPRPQTKQWHVIPNSFSINEWGGSCRFNHPGEPCNLKFSRGRQNRETRSQAWIHRSSIQHFKRHPNRLKHGRVGTMWQPHDSHLCAGLWERERDFISVQWHISIAVAHLLHGGFLHLQDALVQCRIFQPPLFKQRDPLWIKGRGQKSYTAAMQDSRHGRNPLLHNGNIMLTHWNGPRCPCNASDVTCMRNKVTTECRTVLH